jgi:hypothetical protein
MHRVYHLSHRTTVGLLAQRLNGDVRQFVSVT